MHVCEARHREPNRSSAQRHRPRAVSRLELLELCLHLGFGLQLVLHLERQERLAIERASIRSTLLFTTPSSVTRPCSTMMWIGGFTIDANGQKFELP